VQSSTDSDSTLAPKISREAGDISNIKVQPYMVSVVHLQLYHQLYNIPSWGSIQQTEQASTKCTNIQHTRANNFF